MKLIVTDIDGTLIDSPEQKLPSQAIIDTVQSIKNDVLVTCATGRSFLWAKPVLEAAKFTAPCIISGGTLILDQTTLKPIEQKLLPSDQLQNIKDILIEYPYFRVLFNDYTEDDYLSGGWELQRLFDADECHMMEVAHISHEAADELIGKFKQLTGVTSVKMNSILPELADIHVVHEEATKEAAIGYLQRTLGIHKEDTIGIGDGYNDFHIFNAVGTKIAVDNAVPGLKELADEVIGDVKNDAVADFLGRFI